MKKYLRALIPPFVYSIPNVWRNFYLSRNSESKEYQNQSLVNLVIQKNINLRNTKFPIPYDTNSLSVIAAVGLARRESQILNVLDFGGGGGHHQAIVKQAFPDLEIEWQVIETEMMVKEAATSIQVPGLSFSSELNAKRVEETKFDLIFSNSALQYTPDPLATLSHLLSHNFGCIFITRFPVTLGRKSVVYQQQSRLSANGPGPAPEGFRDSFASYENHLSKRCDVEILLENHLQEWHSLDEGPWDLGRFGSQVRTTTYFGFKKEPR